MRCRWLSVWLAGVLGIVLPVRAEESFRMVQVRMGIPMQIVMYADSEEQAEAAARKAFERIGELNAICSDYRDDSELSQLCRDSQPGQPMPVSPDLFRVLQQAQEVSRQSDGAFDVTVAPLVTLWRKARKDRQRPSSEELIAARSRVGWTHLQRDDTQRTVTFDYPDMRLDLGGIAKGYAAQEALAVLRAEGIERAMVDAGGDLMLGAPPPGRRGWSIGIVTGAGEGERKTRVMLSHCAIATSGDRYQFVEIDGVRYSHIIDPRTGLGVQRRGIVTVIDPDGARADAWASALSVLGAKDGIAAAEAAGIMAYVVEQDADGKPIGNAATSHWSKITAPGNPQSDEE